MAVIRLAPRPSQLRRDPLGSVVRDAFGALGIAAAAASLQGFDPSAGWGTPSPDFSTCGVPGSLGLHPPWGVPLPSTWPHGCRARPHDRQRQLHTPSPPNKFGVGGMRSASSNIPGKHPMGTVPCASSFKELGSWLASSEAAGPLRFLSSSPHVRGFGPTVRSRRPSGLRKTKHSTNSLAHRTTWLRSDFPVLQVSKSWEVGWPLPRLPAP